MCFIVPEERIVWLVVPAALMVGGLADLCSDTPKKRGPDIQVFGSIPAAQVDLFTLPSSFA